MALFTFEIEKHGRWEQEETYSGSVIYYNDYSQALEKSNGCLEKHRIAEYEFMAVFESQYSGFPVKVDSVEYQTHLKDTELKEIYKAMVLKRETVWDKN